MTGGRYFGRSIKAASKSEAIVKLQIAGRLLTLNTGEIRPQRTRRRGNTGGSLARRLEDCSLERVTETLLTRL